MVQPDHAAKRQIIEFDMNCALRRMKMSVVEKIDIQVR